MRAAPWIWDLGKITVLTLLWTNISYTERKEVTRASIPPLVLRKLQGFFFCGTVYFLPLSCIVFNLSHSFSPVSVSLAHPHFSLAGVILVQMKYPFIPNSGRVYILKKQHRALTVHLSVSFHWFGRAATHLDQFTSLYHCSGVCGKKQHALMSSGSPLSHPYCSSCFREGCSAFIPSGLFIPQLEM